jgi:hypothetical protein
MAFKESLRLLLLHKVGERVSSGGEVWLAPPPWGLEVGVRYTLSCDDKSVISIELK